MPAAGTVRRPPALTSGVAEMVAEMIVECDGQRHDPVLKAATFNAVTFPAVPGEESVRFEIRHCCCRQGWSTPAEHVPIGDYMSVISGEGMSRRVIARSMAASPTSGGL